MCPADDRFPNLERAAGLLGDRAGDLSQEELRSLLCLDCEFYHEDHDEDLECSCFRILRLLLAGGALTPARLAAALRLGTGGAVRLAPECSLKLLEEPAVYNRKTDELYFISEEAVHFLDGCATGAPGPFDGEAADLTEYCLGEGILERVDSPSPRRLMLKQSPLPSLRYLLMHITERCNLACRHCFRGPAGKAELDLEAIMRAVDEFESMQGLRLMVSGGEPLMHPDFLELNELLADRDLRAVLLTNGILLDEKTAGLLRFEEVQVSLDGIGPSHDFIRGLGSYDRAMRAVHMLLDAGIQVSVATMVHSRNLDDLPLLGETLATMGVREWSVDAPCVTGRLLENRDIAVEPQVAGPLLSLSYGGTIHEPSPGYACGAHLMAVMADGGIARCGFYEDRPVGSLAEGLAAGWQQVRRVGQDELGCDCEFLAECRGGCRYRAAVTGDESEPDVFQCHRYGVR